MKLRLLLLAVVIGPLSLCAFDSAKWMERRAAMTKDAMRLKNEYSKRCKKINAPSEDVVIPLETYPNGSVHTSIFAKKAQFFDGTPYVWAQGLVMKKLDTEGKEKMRLEANRCIIDRINRSGWIQGRAKVTQGKTVFEGDGVYFSATNSYITVYSKSDLKSADMKFGGVK